MRKITLILITSVFLKCTGNTNEVIYKEPVPNASIPVKEGIIKLKSTVGQLLNFYYIDKIKGKPIFLRKNDSLSIVSNAPVYFIVPNESQTPYILFPGDDLTIKKTNAGITFYSVDSIRTKELAFLDKMTAETGAIRNVLPGSYLPQNISLQKRNELILEKYKERQEYFLKYPGSNKFSKDYTEYLSCLLKSCEYEEMLNLDYTGFNYSSLKEFYKDSLQLFAKYFDENLNTGIPQIKSGILALACVYCGIKEHAHFLDNLNDAQLIAISDNINAHLPSHSSDYLQTTITSYFINRHADKKIIDNLLKKIKGTEYLAFLESGKNDLPNGPVPQNIYSERLIRTNLESLNLKSVLSKDSVIVLDFWASWCKPCIEEFGSMKSLENEFSNKPVKFIKISIDKNQNDWLDATVTYNLNQNSFRLSDPENSLIIKQWKINSVPRYIVINAKGKVMNDDAPRPSDKALKILIEGILKSQR